MYDVTAARYSGSLFGGALCGPSLFCAMTLDVISINSLTCRLLVAANYTLHRPSGGDGGGVGAIVIGEEVLHEAVDFSRAAEQMS